MQLKEILDRLEQLSPASFAMDWDNSGFLFGDRQAQINRVLISADVTKDVVKEAVAIKNLPSTKAPETAIIHEGTCVRITDKDMKGWFGIRLSDGREGWVRAAYVELI